MTPPPPKKNFEPPPPRRKLGGQSRGSKFFCLSPISDHFLIKKKKKKKKKKLGGICPWIRGARNFCDPPPPRTETRGVNQGGHSYIAAFLLIPFSLPSSEVLPILGRGVRGAVGLAKGEGCLLCHPCCGGSGLAKGGGTGGGDREGRWGPGGQGDRRPGAARRGGGAPRTDFLRDLLIH